ncbi:MAG: DUF4145 domain-containing protein [Leptolyngbyaceae cyanobacterium RM2_2_4]|nr:DUF4145 domain-containing protein [Leptolyngbyaceae cyanobacterium SM1_4_3]NJN90946.1 DUF4145 domain-containing protein [Leptolyngbyaceae cyanobacterium SL_5_14]NJO50467.1 DUF4145 domain-containing protein [Leptolyngbyaceae cyanobacterium RM2_2_4]
MLYELGTEREFCNCGNLMKRESTFRHRRGDYDNSYYTIEIFEIFTCLACNEATLICYSALGNDDEDEINRDDVEKELYREYHRTVLHAPNKRLHHAIPRSIAEVTYQAQSVLSKSPRASFILCRAVLEEICNDFKVPAQSLNNKGKSHFVNLNERLIQLFEQERMSEDLIAIIQGIRELGNEGTHSDHLTFAKQVKVEDADNLLMLVNYVIERLYADKCRQQEAAEVLSKLKGKISNYTNSL